MCSYGPVYHRCVRIVFQHKDTHSAVAGIHFSFISEYYLKVTRGRWLSPPPPPRHPLSLSLSLSDSFLSRTTIPFYFLISRHLLISSSSSSFFFFFICPPCVPLMNTGTCGPPRSHHAPDWTKPVTLTLTNRKPEGESCAERGIGELNCVFDLHTFTTQMMLSWEAAVEDLLVCSEFINFLWH